MAEATIASAVAPAEPLEEEPSTNALKRRQSEGSDHEKDSKRQRMSPGKNSPEPRRDDADSSKPTEDEQPKKEKAADPREARRKTSIADEKGRSKRLFGALLGSLNQPSDRTSKRRQEIESRRKAELQRQDDERIEDKQRRQEKLTEQRKKVQVEVDEQNMHIRHRSMLDSANFLQTVAEPKIYYRPWDLRPDEEDRIDEQIKDVQMRIDRELEEFEQRLQNSKYSGSPNNAKIQRNGDSSPPEKALESSRPDAKTGNDKDAAVEEDAPAKSANNDASQQAEMPEPDPTDPTTNNPESEQANPVNSQLAANEEVEEEDGHVVEGDEDAVIY